MSGSATRAATCCAPGARGSPIHRTWLPKRSGGHRLIETPKPLIKSVQRRVLRRILDAMPPHECAEGFVRGRSPLSHAARHTASSALLCLDRLEAILTNCRRHGVAGQNRDGHADFRGHLRGRIAWVQSVAPARGARLLELFEGIDWR